MLTKTDLHAIEDVVGSKIKKELKPIKRDINRIKKDIDYMIGKFDENDVKLGRRVKRIEAHLNLPPVQ